MEKVILFGASNLGERAYEILKDEFDVIHFSDNDTRKFGIQFCGVEVISPKLLTKHNDCKVIITSMYYKEIYKQLKLLNVTNIYIFELVEKITTYKISLIESESEIDYINAAGFDNDGDIYKNNYNEESLDNKKFYNIGAGSFKHRYWTNIDYYSECYKENFKSNNSYISYDILSMEEIPLKENTAEVFYTSHTIEHVSDEANMNLFKNVYRMLKKGGYFRVTTMDIDLMYKAYENNDRDFFYFEKNSIYSLEQLLLSEFATQLSSITETNNLKLDDVEFRNIFLNNKYEDALNYIISLCDVEIQKNNSSNHINWFNKNKICRMLKSAGFSNIYISAYGQSMCPILRDTNYFDNTHPKLSLYIEAVK